MSFTTLDGDLLPEGPATPEARVEVRTLGWPRPVPLGRMPAVPGLPLTLLPPWLSEWAAAVAESVQVPADLPALVGLTVAAAGVARKVRVHVRSDWAEPTNLYSAVLLRTGERKSKVFELALAPLRHLTDQLRRQTRKQSVSSRFGRGIMAGKLKRLAKNLTDCRDEAEVEPLFEQAKDLMMTLETNAPPPCPVLVADEQALDLLGQLLIEQGGRILIASPEGTPLESLKGLNSGRSNLEVYLKGHSGEPIEIGGVGRDRNRIDRPALSMALAVSPFGMRGPGKDMTLAQRGFLARILYACPDSLVGLRQVGTARIPKEIATGYQQAILGLWGMDYARKNKHGKDIAHQVRFSAAGAAVMEEFERWLEPQLGMDGSLARLAGWGNKLAGSCARIAGVLHLCGGMGQGGTEIAQTTVEAAIRLGREYFLPHARAAFHLMEEDPRISLAARILRWAKKEQLRTFSRRDCHTRFHTAIERVEDLATPLKLLEDHGWLRAVVEPERSGPGRKPSPVFEVYPEMDRLDHGASSDPWDKMAPNG